MKKAAVAVLLLIACLPHCSKHVISGHMESAAGSPIDNLFPLNYAWLRVTSVESRSGGMVRQISGEIVAAESEILGVERLSDGIIAIEKRPDGNWYLPANIYFRDGEIVNNQVYKVVYEFSDVPPSGKIAIRLLGM